MQSNWPFGTTFPGLTENKLSYKFPVQHLKTIFLLREDFSLLLSTLCVTFASLAGGAFSDAPRANF